MDVKHWLVCGGTGRGKTYFVKNYILKTIEEKGIKCIIVDVEDEYDYQKSELNDLLENLNKYGIVRVVPPSLEDERVDFLYKLYKFIFESLRGVVVLLEEGHRIGARSRATMSSKNIHTTAMWDLLSRGRKRRIKCIITSQRPSALDTNIIAHCTIRTLFKVNEPIDWERYKKMIDHNYLIKLLESKNFHAWITMVDGEIYAYSL